jgi:Ca2+-binding EF-hand superfamily protein
MPPVMRPMTAAERRRAPSAAREANLRAMQARPMSARGPPARSTAAPPARFSASQQPVDISYEENYAAPPPLLPPPPIAPTAVVERVAEAETILVEMRTALKQPAVGPDSGLAGLARNFRLRDSRQSKRLELNEFAECVALCKLGLSAEKIGKLFSRFDVDGSGIIDYVEFLQSVRGPLSAARKKVVIQAFHALDAMGHGDGLIALDLLHEHYDAHKHPSVVSGRVDAGSALRSFVEGFGGETVALDDFLGYYEEVSASMATDDAFCSLVASTWGRLKVRGSDRPAVSFVPKKEVDALERLLFDASYRRKGGSAHSQERLINEAFKLFDVDGSGNVDCHEFLKAMERFGLHVRGKGKMGIGGLKESVVLALFDRYDKDASGTLDFREFSAAFLGSYQELDTGIEADEFKKKPPPADPEDDSWMRHPLKKHDHELLAARQPSGMSRPGYAGYLSQAVKVHGSQGGGKGQSSGAPFKVGRPAP